MPILAISLSKPIHPRTTHLFPLFAVSKHSITWPGIKNKFVWQLNQEVLFYSLIVSYIKLSNNTTCPGCHLVHQEIVSQVPEIRDYKVGMANFFCKYLATRFNSSLTWFIHSWHATVIVQHTSASLMINENADRTVRSDMSMGLDKIVPEDWPYQHDYEGSDDMVGLEIRWWCRCSMMATHYCRII